MLPSLARQVFVLSAGFFRPELRATCAKVVPGSLAIPRSQPQAAGPHRSRSNLCRRFVAEFGNYATNTPGIPGVCVAKIEIIAFAIRPSPFDL
jgi:hypothetical protein